MRKWTLYDVLEAAQRYLSKKWEDKVIEGVQRRILFECVTEAASNLVVQVET